jgi:hypothetical protein
MGATRMWTMTIRSGIIRVRAMSCSFHHHSSAGRADGPMRCRERLVDCANPTRERSHEFLDHTVFPSPVHLGCRRSSHVTTPVGAPSCPPLEFPGSSSAWGAPTLPSASRHVPNGRGPGLTPRGQLALAPLPLDAVWGASTAPSSAARTTASGADVPSPGGCPARCPTLCGGAAVSGGK